MVTCHCTAYASYAYVGLRHIMGADKPDDIFLIVRDQEKSVSAFCICGIEIKVVTLRLLQISAAAFAAEGVLVNSSQP